MAEIGIPIRRRVLVPSTEPLETPYPSPPKRDAPPAEQPATEPEKEPA